MPGIIAPPRQLWTPPVRPVIRPPGVRPASLRDLTRWRRSVPTLNAGKLQRDPDTRKLIRRSDTRKLRRSETDDPCDCECVAINYIQWRKCSDDTLADLWSRDIYTTDPITGDPLAYPYGMILRSDGLCYYHDEGDPTSTTPGTVVDPVAPPTYSVGDFVFIPQGFACSDAFCAPHTCSVTCALGITPAVILLDFSSIDLFQAGCVSCDNGAGCLGLGYSIEGAGDASTFNRRFLCLWEDFDCCYSAFAGDGKREEVYSELLYDWPDCSPTPTDLCGGFPCCDGDTYPFDLWHDYGDPDPGTYWNVGVCLLPDSFAVSIYQSQGAATIYFFDAKIPFASTERCDLPVSGSNDPDPAFVGGVCTGSMRGDGGFVNVIPLV